ncbi:hypothetical protein JMI89_08110 [Frischella sp. Ac48]|uniref:hypothetical protein n=1 Tax=Frischella sp. Ac48 TaxID=2804531 RepID=UPI001C7CBABD|nr:hypothetical protein [Frischella sp. Ac48]MBX4133594.1 hypothetical protein [Frischella sp. Ac48]
MEIYKNNTSPNFIKLNYIIKLLTVIAPKLIYQIPPVLLLLVFSNINIANALISSTSSKSIQGNPPEFFITDSVKNKLGFTYNQTDYSESIGNIQSDSILYFDNPMTNLNDFKMKTFFTERQAINDSTGEYYDADGDGFADIPVTQELTFIWRDNNQTQIDANDYENIGCHNNKYAMPLTLEIISKNIQVHTKYGHPNTSDPVQQASIIKAYQLAFVGMCYAKPNSLIVDPNTQWRAVRADYTDADAWNPTGIGINGSKQDRPNERFGGGYTADYVANLGFKVKPTVSDKTFPTTGFDGAQFQLVMGGSQEDYNYSISYNNGTFTVDKNGMITFVDKSQPEDEIIITAALKSNSEYTFKYKFKISLWVYPGELISSRAENQVSKFNEKCTKKNKSLVGRNDLNANTWYSKNSLDFDKTPSDINVQNRDIQFNVFIRGIGNGVLGEWGRLVQQGAKSSDTYPKSKWVSGWFFVNETRKNRFGGEEAIIVSILDGMISYMSSWSGFRDRSYACK